MKKLFENNSTAKVWATLTAAWLGNFVIILGYFLTIKIIPH